ncbi:cell division protein ZapA [Sphingomonas morindae]|uniref:Cell division protein ZapA n=1 Tax=Sphingomonas morindae TaxID=1541170 RepID=A0ABY4XA02_9SPHN|nr:cell division protein ZapA [Sphingomonas morindae]USI73698.1 cell division protein ZapA [Sphingomonas morindae]
MADVPIEVGGRAYTLACREGEQDRVRLLARLVDSRLTEARRAVGRGQEARELLLAAMLLADELDEQRTASAGIRIEGEARLAALERCAVRLEALVAALEKPAPAS